VAIDHWDENAPKPDLIKKTIRIMEDKIGVNDGEQGTQSGYTRLTHNGSSDGTPDWGPVVKPGPK
jgi:hypothetical protein